MKFKLNQLFNTVIFLPPGFPMYVFLTEHVTNLREHGE